MKDAERDARKAANWTVTSCRASLRGPHQTSSRVFEEEKARVSLRFSDGVRSRGPEASRATHTRPNMPLVRKHSSARTRKLERVRSLESEVVPGSAVGRAPVARASSAPVVQHDGREARAREAAAVGAAQVVAAGLATADRGRVAAQSGAQSGARLWHVPRAVRAVQGRLDDDARVLLKEWLRPLFGRGIYMESVLESPTLDRPRVALELLSK